MTHSLVGYLRWRNSLPDLSRQSEDDAWFAFRRAHEDRCATCRLECDRLVVDHDHTTGLIRGLLCRSCNGVMPSSARHANRVGLGRMTHVMVLYTQWPPSAVMGMRARYAPVVGRDPAPRLHEILWHATREGLEHDRERRRDAMAAAIEKLTTL